MHCMCCLACRPPPDIGPVLLPVWLPPRPFWSPPGLLAASSVAAWCLPLLPRALGLRVPPSCAALPDSWMHACVLPLSLEISVAGPLCPPIGRGCMPRIRDAHGKYARAPRAPVALRHILSSRGRHGTPFYLACPAAILVASMPAQLRSAVLGAGVTATAAWDPKATDLRAEITKLLDHIGGVLAAADKADQEQSDDTAAAPRQLQLSGSEAFTLPPGPVPSLNKGSCIIPSTQEIKNTKGVDPMNKTYLHVKVGRISSKSYMKEALHRIVLWACYGPAPAGIADPVVMHICSQHGPAAWKCLNPEHLVWGEMGINLGRWAVQVAGAAQEARTRQLEQRGYMFA